MTDEALIRVSAFVLVLGMMALWEWRAPRRPYVDKKPPRWLANIGMVALATLLVRLLFPLTAVASAVLAHERGWGLFNLWPLPQWLAIMAAVALLDLVIYFQHVLFHAVPVLWRLHMVHHSDRDFDASTGLRFHPIEIALSLCLKMGAIVALGAPPVAVLIFEVLLNGITIFNHGNVALAPRLDRWLRLIVVTPEMHRVHHSVIARETNSNFGFNLPWWDRLFGTYRAQPQAGHLGMRIGLTQFGHARLALWPLLLLPFTGRTGDYPIGQRR
jgi:sterol desaturase/sphingolipid hydroxylase (fatty acid hydroxylase superfamily)